MSYLRGTDSDGNRLLGIGITKRTFARMLQGEAMTVDLAKLGVPGVKFIILAGSDDAAITRDLQEAISKHTKVQIHPAAIIRNEP